MKYLVNPLLLFLLMQIGVAGYLWRRHKSLKRAPLLLLCIGVLLCVLSMPISGVILEASLKINTPQVATVVPTHIFVLGGGYQIGLQADDDLLIFESQRRVLHGVNVWKSHPAAYLVFSGASLEYGRNNARQAELARDMASVRGVPLSYVLLETQSRNTREHPLAALRIPGVSATTPVGVVTSAWHTRRAQSEFCRHFQHVVVFPVPNVVHALKWQDVVPDAEALDVSTTLLREWVGLLWYAIAHYPESHSSESSFCIP